MSREPGEGPRRWLRATYRRAGGVRHLFAALELGTEQGSMIRRDIAWRNRHTADPRLRRIVKRTSAA